MQLIPMLVQEGCVQPWGGLIWLPPSCLLPTVAITGPQKRFLLVSTVTIWAKKQPIGLELVCLNQ